MSLLQNHKAELRKQQLALRKAMPAVERQTQSVEVACCALEALPWAHIGCYSTFLPIVAKGEVDTYLLIEAVQQAFPQVLCAVPVVVGHHLIHRQLTDKHALVQNSWGIEEPTTEAPEIALAQLDLVVVPLLAFNAEGHRIGYGKGFYDSLLAGCKPTTLFVGVGFSHAFVPHFEGEAHDVPLHMAITPEGVYSFSEPVVE